MYRDDLEARVSRLEQRLSETTAAEKEVKQFRKQQHRERDWERFRELLGVFIGPSVAAGVICALVAGIVHSCNVAAAENQRRCHVMCNAHGYTPAWTDDAHETSACVCVCAGDGELHRFQCRDGEPVE